MGKRKNIGFLGGSFDPIHNGHINLAFQMMEIHKLDGILFSPARCSPFKEKKPPNASYLDRYEMLKIAIADIDDFHLTDIESREGLSYTIDTFMLLSGNSEYREKDFQLIITEDTAKLFYKWKKADKLIEMAPPLIGKRTGQPLDFTNYPSSSLAPLLKKGLTDTSIIDISSTEIRLRLKKNLYSSHLMSPKVLDYIYNHDLYCCHENR